MYGLNSINLGLNSTIYQPLFYTTHSSNNFLSHNSDGIPNTNATFHIAHQVAPKIIHK